MLVRCGAVVQTLHQVLLLGLQSRPWHSRFCPLPRRLLRSPSASPRRLAGSTTPRRSVSFSSTLPCTSSTSVASIRDGSARCRHRGDAVSTADGVEQRRLAESCRGAGRAVDRLGPTGRRARRLGCHVGVLLRRSPLGTKPHGPRDPRRDGNPTALGGLRSADQAGTGPVVSPPGVWLRRRSGRPLCRHLGTSVSARTPSSGPGGARPSLDALRRRS